MLLTKQKHYRKDNRYGYETGRSPFIDYILEDKESYKPLSSSICRITGKRWIDKDNDFSMTLCDLSWLTLPTKLTPCAN